MAPPGKMASGGPRPSRALEAAPTAARLWASTSARTLARRRRRQWTEEYGLTKAHALRQRAQIICLALQEHWELSAVLGYHEPQHLDSLKALDLCNGRSTSRSCSDALRLANWARHAPPPGTPCRPPAPPAGALDASALEAFRAELYTVQETVPNHKEPPSTGAECSSRIIDTKEIIQPGQAAAEVSVDYLLPVDRCNSSGEWAAAPLFNSVETVHTNVCAEPDAVPLSDPSYAEHVTGMDSHAYMLSLTGAEELADPHATSEHLEVGKTAFIYEGRVDTFLAATSQEHSDQSISRGELLEAIATQAQEAIQRCWQSGEADIDLLTVEGIGAIEDHIHSESELIATTAFIRRQIEDRIAVNREET